MTIHELVEKIYFQGKAEAFEECAKIAEDHGLIEYHDDTTCQCDQIIAEKIRQRAKEHKKYECNE